MMSEKKIKYALIGGVVLNLAMCLNLYRQMVSIEYQVKQIESDSMNSIQALSRYVWEMKNPHLNNNRTGEFE